MIVPETIVIPLDGSFAEALSGSLRIVHEPIVYSVASKWMVDIFPCSLIVLILAILANLHFMVEQVMRVPNVYYR
ncbi:MAG: hypothetical protein NVSMB42_13790 [Herpetosiphon sp.]